MSEISTDDKLKAEALEWLVSLRGTAEQAKSFAIENAPDVLREMVLVGRVSVTVEFVTMICLALIAAWYIRRFGRRDASDTSPESDLAWGLGLVVALFVGVLSAFGIMLGIKELTTVWLAPRLYIIEHLAEMMKAVKS